MSISRKSLLASLIVALVLSRPSHAAVRTWIGGNTAWVDGAGNNANWTGNDEPDPDDDAVFNTANSVTLGSANTVLSLTMSAGIDLETNGNDLTVAGLVQLVDASTNLVVDGAAASLSAEDVTINNGGQVRLDDGLLSVVVGGVASSLLDVNAGGTLSGNGTVNMGDSLAAVTSLIINDGTITASSPSLLFGAPPVGTLSLNAADAIDARINLDGTGENGVVNVFRNQTLDVNITLSDAFTGDMNLTHNATIDIEDPWTLNTGGTIDVDNGFSPGFPPTVPAIPAGVAFISGGTFTQTGGTITVVDTDGTLQFNALFIQTGGALANNGLVVFNANATIGPGADFTMPSAFSSITVNAGVTVNVDQPNFNADAGGAAGNVITVNSGGVLDLDLGVGGDGTFDNIVTLNGGELDVTTATGDWVIEDTVNLNNVSGNPAILDGQPLAIGNDAGSLDANVNVGGAGVSNISTPVTFFSDADVNIAAGATLEIVDNATFNSVNGAENAEFTGNGILELEGSNNVINEDTTINMPGGRIDLDGGGGGVIITSAQTLTLNGLDADLTLNVAGIDTEDNTFGKNNLLGAADTIVLNSSADLIVNLTDPNAEWTLNSNAVLDINALGGMFGGSGIQGSDFNMAGAADISGNSIWGARTDISGTATVAAGGSLNLRGGDLTDANVNRLVGGTITGAGALRALMDEGLSGFGTINTDIEFAGNTELRADDGTLNIDGPIVDVGVIGTADDDGVLDVALAWNTSIANNLVELRGGTLSGATITNGLAAGINGHGLLSAPVVNNTRIDAEGGGTLLVQTAANNNDWDGAGNTGDLNAVSADLEIVDDTMFTFQGGVAANNSFEVFVNGFQMDFASAATLSLSGGTYRSTHNMRMGGTLQSNTATSTLGITGTALLLGTSNTVLNSDLHLDNTNTAVAAGATFSGGGALVNLNGSQLSLADGAVVGVLVENEGNLEINAGTDGRADVDDFQQSATGQLTIDLAGTGLNDFDRLVINGAAQIAGALDLNLIGAYVPAVADPPLTILSAAGGVTGMFTAVSQPASMPAGLVFDVIYTPTMVQLDVVNAPIFSADFDLDGDVDGDDLTQWEGDMGVNDQSDADNDGDSDGSDFLAWQQQVGSVPAVESVGAVPEPATAILAALSLLAAAGRLRYWG